MLSVCQTCPKPKCDFCQDIAPVQQVKETVVILVCPQCGDAFTLDVVLYNALFDMGTLIKCTKCCLPRPEPLLP